MPNRTTRPRTPKPPRPACPACGGRLFPGLGKPACERCTRFVPASPTIPYALTRLVPRKAVR